MTSSLSATAATPTADDLHRLYMRSLTVVVISQVFGGAGLAAGVTVGALLAQGMLGGEGVAGIVLAAVLESLILFFTALFVYGSRTATNLPLRRWQDELVYSYHRGEWRPDVWHPLLDPRVPPCDHEPNGRSVVNFAHLTSRWLREAAKWWLGDTLASGRYTWSSLKTRNDGLKWLQRHLTATTDAGSDSGHRSR